MLGWIKLALNKENRNIKNAKETINLKTLTLIMLGFLRVVFSGDSGGRGEFNSNPPSYFKKNFLTSILLYTIVKQSV